MQGIDIIWGDLLRLRADCICVSAGPDFLHEKGMSRAVYNKIGKQAWAGLEDLKASVGPGDVIVTPPFGFNANWLFHVIGPMWDGDGGHAENVLYATAALCFKLARERECHTMLMPLLSAGEKGFPHNVAWRTILRALLDFFEKEPEYDLEVTFVTRHPGIRRIGERELEQLTGFKFRGIKS